MDEVAELEFLYGVDALMQTFVERYEQMVLAAANRADFKTVRELRAIADRQVEFLARRREEEAGKST